MKLSLTKVSRLGRFLLALKPQYVIVVGVITLLLAIFYMLPGQRSFLVDAKSLGMNIEFVEDASINTWRLAGGAVICRFAPTESPLPNSDAPAVCPPGEFEVEVSEGPLGLTWPGGVLLDVFATPDGGLALILIGTQSDEVVTLGSGRRPIGVDDMLVLPRQTFVESGSLPFAAQAQIGAEASAGSRTLLVSGEYAIREQLIGRSQLITVATGVLHRGDKVSFVDSQGQRPVLSYGFIASDLALSSDRRQAPFHVVAYSEMAFSQMHVDRYGAQRSVVTSDWTQRAVNDPLLIGGTVLLTLVSLFISILSSLIKNTQIANMDQEKRRAAPGRRPAVVDDKASS